MLNELTMYLVKNKLIYNLLLICKPIHGQKKRIITCANWTITGFLFYLGYDPFYPTIYPFSILWSLCLSLKTIDLSSILIYTGKIAGNWPEFFENLCNINRSKARKPWTTYADAFVVIFSIIKIAFIYIALNALDFTTLTNTMLINFWQLKKCEKNCDKHWLKESICQLIGCCYIILKSRNHAQLDHFIDWKQRVLCSTLIKH